MPSVSGPKNMSCSWCRGMISEPPGYVRIAYCVTTDQIRRSLPAFQALAEEYGKSARIKKYGSQSR